MGGQVADWLVTLQNRVKLELLSADRLDNVRDTIERFAGFVGPKRTGGRNQRRRYESYPLRPGSIVSLGIVPKRKVPA